MRRLTRPTVLVRENGTFLVHSKSHQQTTQKDRHVCSVATNRNRQSYLRFGNPWRKMSKPYLPTNTDELVECMTIEDAELEGGKQNQRTQRQTTMGGSRGCGHSRCHYC